MGLLWALAASALAAPGADAAWADLSAGQRAALAPLREEWPRIDGARREKWLELAARFPAMPEAERQRVQARMSAWANLSPAERGQARLQFQEAQRWTPQERQARWEAYQSLHPQARQVLAERWRLGAPGPDGAAVRSSGAKRNLVETPVPAATPPKSASPTSVRAATGATTQPIPRTPGADFPLHQPGVPKIAATDAFVDPATMLPRRGPQGAAVTAPKAAAPARRQP